MIYYLPSQNGPDDAYTSISTFNFHANAHFAFVGNFEENSGFYFYGLAGISLNYYSLSTNISGKDVQSNGGTNIDLGLGLAYAVNEHVQFFIEPKLVIGTGSGNSRDGGHFDPGYVSWLNTGIRLYFGD